MRRVRCPKRTGTSLTGTWGKRGSPQSRRCSMTTHSQTTRRDLCCSTASTLFAWMQCAVKQWCRRSSCPRCCLHQRRRLFAVAAILPCGSAAAGSAVSRTTRVVAASSRCLPRGLARRSATAASARLGCSGGGGAPGSSVQGALSSSSPRWSEMSQPSSARRTWSARRRARRRRSSRAALGAAAAFRCGAARRRCALSSFGRWARGYPTCNLQPLREGPLREGPRCEGPLLEGPRCRWPLAL
mmetsp:Transcript_39091/g.91461  ORF Transcript_39091/g.91461 Transcript_39091/m.91461 type:complete len:242 (+) Transcript_39091:169-894(+)